QNKKSFKNLYNWGLYTWREKHLQRNLHEIFGIVNVPLLFVEQQVAKAAAAFYTSPFTEAAVMILADFGETDVEWLGMGYENKLEVLQTQAFPHSLGWLNQIFIDFLGLKPYQDNIKLIELAAEGQPLYKNKILEKIFIFFENNAFEIFSNNLKQAYDLKTAKIFIENTLKIPPRKKTDSLTQIYLDLAASWQAALEEITLRKAKYLSGHYQLPTLCYGGEVAFNYLNNANLIKQSSFKKVWVQPAPGKAGGAIGAALYGWYFFLNNQRTVKSAGNIQNSFLLGPTFSDEEIKAYLDRKKIHYRYFEDEEACINTMVRHLMSGQTVGWLSGRMDFGENILGTRSIFLSPKHLEDAEKKEFKSMLKVSVLEESFDKYFNVEEKSPYAMYTVSPKLEMRNKFPLLKDANLIRVQTVNKQDNPQLHKLLTILKEKADFDLLINLPFNTKKNTLVCTPQDAYQNFMRMNLDYLIVERFFISKKGGL
ncbi:MAG: hypothetical protein KKA19_01200, partial [Candidatus Margulisbacteria bacterium]|nr:hypothetical protein [Candidatus Margulisiibacteriota bacterium]